MVNKIVRVVAAVFLFAVIAFPALGVRAGSAAGVVYRPSPYAIGTGQTISNAWTCVGGAEFVTWGDVVLTQKAVAFVFVAGGSFPGSVFGQAGDKLGCLPSQGYPIIGVNGGANHTGGAGSIGCFYSVGYSAACAAAGVLGSYGSHAALWDSSGITAGTYQININLAPNNTCACDGSPFTVYPIYDVAPSATPSPTSTVTPTSLIHGQPCVTRKSTATPGPSPTELPLTALPTASPTSALPGPGTPYPTRYAPPPVDNSGVPITPPRFNFNSDPASYGPPLWQVEGVGGWSRYFGRGGGGSMYFGSDAAIASSSLVAASLIYNGTWDANWYVTGYFMVVDDPNYNVEASLDVSAWTDHGSYWGWGNSGLQDEIYWGFNSSLQWSSFEPFVIRPGVDGDKLRIKMHFAPSGIVNFDAYAIFFDDIKFMSPGEISETTCDENGDPVASPTIGPWATAPVFPTPIGGPGSTGVVIDHLSGLQCYGFDAFSISFFGAASFGLDSTKVCFDRYAVTTLMFGGFDLLWLVALVVVALPIMVAIEAVRKARGG